MKISNLKFVIVAVFVVLIAAGATFGQTTKRATVAWISIDGFRGEYLDRGITPTLSRLAKEGAYTKQLRPVFPSVTFPNHVSQVTGTPVKGHGIVGNTFYDSERKEFFRFPSDGTLLRSEPIWVTAKRQGVRSAVADWPVGQAQKGEFIADYFNDKFNSKETDEQRLNRLLKYYQDDSKDPPLRLLIGYVSKVDGSGHQFGPDSKQANEALSNVDNQVAGFLKALQERFDAIRKADDELYVVFTADHGMCPVQQTHHLKSLLGPELGKGATLLLDGPVADIWLNDVAAEAREAQAKKIVEKLNTLPSMRAYRRGSLPEQWRNEDSTRSGDVFVVLGPGHTFTARDPSTQPVSGSKGMHGYDPEVCSDMNGGAIIWRAGRPIGGKDLGPIDNTQWHATIARLLGIEPSAAADKRAIVIE